jgi:hypothetical protein
VDWTHAADDRSCEHEDEPLGSRKGRQFDKLNDCELCSVISYSSSNFGIICLPRHKITLYISQPTFTFFSFQENTYIHISQLFVSLSVGILSMLGLNDHKN